MSSKQTFRKMLIFVVTVSLVASVTVTPVSAEDDLTLGSDGISLGDEDGISVSSSDGDAGVTVSADADTDGVNVAVEGSGGGTSVGVQCDVDSSTDGNPCSTSSGSGDEAPSAPDLPSDGLPDGELPDAPSAPGLPSGELPDGELPNATIVGGGSGVSDAGQAVEDGVGQAPSHLSTDQLPLDSAPLPADPSAGVTRPGVSIGNDSAVVATRYFTFGENMGTTGWVALVGSSDKVYVSHSPDISNQNDDYRGADTVEVHPDAGTVDANVRRTGVDHVAGSQVSSDAIGTKVNCDLSAGYLQLCSMTNAVPAKTSDLPADRLPALPDQVKEQAPVSKGMLLFVTDEAVKQPNSVVSLAIAQAGSNTPEQSPINPANPPYNPNQPPINLADPQGSVDPNWWAHRRQSSIGQDGIIQTGAGGARLNDEMFVESQYASILRNDGDQINVISLRGSDGQNQYRSRTKTSNQTLQTTSDGPIGGSATLGPDQQTGSIGMALGGQEYERSFGSDGGSGAIAPGLPSDIPGSLPIDPSQPPSSPV